MKRLICFAVCIFLAGCGLLPDAPEVEPERGTTAREEEVVEFNGEQDIWNMIIDDIRAEGFDVIGSFGRYYYGYDTTVMAGDGSNFCIFDEYGRKADIEWPEWTNGLSRSGWAASYGDLYEVVRQFDDDSSVMLIRINGDDLSVEPLFSIPYDDDTDADIRLNLRPTDSGVIVEKTVSTYNYLGSSRTVQYTAWIYDRNSGGKEVINETMSYRSSDADSSGVEVIGTFLRDGELHAIGTGIRDGKLELVLCRYSLEGALLGTKKIGTPAFTVASSDAILLGDGVALLYNGAVYIMKGGEEWEHRDVRYAYNSDYLIAFNPDSGHGIVYDLESGESVTFAAEEVKGREISIFATEYGFGAVVDGQTFVVKNVEEIFK